MPPYRRKNFFVSTALLSSLALFGAIAYWGPNVANSFFSPPASAKLIAEASEEAVIFPQATTATTSERTIATLSIQEAVPATGKFIAADLVNMRLYIYEDGTTTAEYPILTKGRPGSPYETPSGAYSILTKEADHFNHAEQVHMPYSMQFYGNYFVHGWPYYPSG